MNTDGAAYGGASSGNGGWAETSDGGASLGRSLFPARRSRSFVSRIKDRWVSHSLNSMLLPDGLILLGAMGLVGVDFAVFSPMPSASSPVPIRPGRPAEVAACRCRSAPTRVWHGYLPKAPPGQCDFAWPTSGPETTALIRTSRLEPL